MTDLFEYNKQTDIDISVLLLLIKEKDLKFKKQIRYFVINSVSMLKQMFYEADIEPDKKSPFKGVSQELSSYLQDSSREQLFQIIRNLSWLFVAVFAVRNKNEAIKIKAEAETALGHLNVCEQSYNAIVNSPKYDLYTVFVEFDKICGLILKKNKINDPTVGYIFCHAFSDLFLYAIASCEENMPAETAKL
jgi:hypothetical protein